MWIVKSGNLAFNLDKVDDIYVEENKLFLDYLEDETKIRRFDFESHEHAKQAFHHIINALKRKEEVLFL